MREEGRFKDVTPSSNSIDIQRELRLHVRASRKDINGCKFGDPMKHHTNSGRREKWCLTKHNDTRPSKCQGIRPKQQGFVSVVASLDRKVKVPKHRKDQQTDLAKNFVTWFVEVHRNRHCYP